MATSYTNVGVSPTNTIRNLLYSAPSGVETAIVFAGNASNKDTIARGPVLLTLELEYSPGQFRFIGTDIQVPYGISPGIPKIALSANQKLYVTISRANLLDVHISVIEKGIS